MHKQTQQWLVAGLLAVAPVAFAQQTAPAPAAGAAAAVTSPAGTPATPARQAPPPEDLEPGVNTSAMPANTAPPSPPAPAVAPASKSPNGGNSSAAAGAAAGPTASKSSKTSKPARSDAAATAAGANSGAGATTATGSNSGAGAKGGKAEDHLQLDTTQITGNQELPKVLYIVPWKRSDLGDMLGRPANSLLDEVLQPVDRDVFRRENRYYDALKPDAGGAGGKAAGAGVQPSGDKH
jgi:hypothetical protein